MPPIGYNYALVKASSDSDNITITLNWNGRELNLDRKKSETLNVTLARLKRSLQKNSNPLSKRQTNVIDVELCDQPTGKCEMWRKPKKTTDMCDTSIMESTIENSMSASLTAITTVVGDYSISFLTNMFKPIEEDKTLEEVIQNASFISVNDTLIQVHTNVFRVQEVRVGPRAMVGCPVSLHVESDGHWRNDVYVEWLDEKGCILHHGPIYVPTEDMEGRHIKARVSHKQLRWNVVNSNYCEVFDSPKNRWQQERIVAFNNAPVKNSLLHLQSKQGGIRVMSFNILSPTYVSNEEAIDRFFPYCSPEWLDSSFRNPLILREILLVNPQVICLQECSTSAYREYMEPILSQNYHAWLTIKNQASDEGCCMFLQKGVFDVLEVQGISFKEEIIKPEYRGVLTRIGAANWLNYDPDTYFNRYHTIFQMCCVRNKLDDGGGVLFLANTHLYFHPHGRHIRLLQAYVLLNELERFKRQCGNKHSFDVNVESSTIICGDFNSFNTEGTFQIITNGWVPYDHEDFDYGLKFGYERFNPNEHNAKFPRGRKEENASRRSDSEERLEVPNCTGYQDSYGGEELPFTNFVKTFSGTLDYIFHSKNLQVKRCMPGISQEDAEEFEGLPSKLYPSDHISIAVDFF
ncbi:endonuclease/exonuclease/phosphatase family protein, putative [Babesia bigemina]|uniref:Endonuclease/exonuclease/phosphatase family protein, putative n=1 Tax=Babesia bigemina TaxID=5866 RepID=A0A061D3R6_BABBI|nr:endonuclease/exonuclease/phosphatase family protein, putative [Babesia bigemina]CDR95346.1 endonuclease/exonuclease/phosphatase family protein, putative [Babesia bigemina]|eukprot:XP_012767532.1 endonuclease/exonuclease/phosphatase family protein, putative [Babesia bigemina]